ncbi:polysaccharide deacetylase family protein [Roseomonas sp. CCTCC AB2023176]|uniref:polysaccharide deacetylase family protein n=1 Tax=Roseomonas sp. CCTCC AB2023176 TaxID=3342640 RepID=UPI0035DE44ED
MNEAPGPSPPALRAVVPHVDDLGMCHGANRAFLELAAAGHVTCGSVMVPCPWFREIAEAGAADPSLDLGVHLTLTSEWQGYRWAPVSTVSRASGLVDGDGFFWRDVASLARHVVPEAAEAELRAQMDRALAAGLRPTHLDAHMAAAMLPQLLDAHVRIAVDYGAFPVLPRAIRFAPDAARYAEAIAALDRAGLPVVDEIRGTLPVAEEDLAARWDGMIAGLPAGVTHLALHATVPGDFQAISPQHAAWRFAEYRHLASGAATRAFEAAGIRRLGMRELQATWRRALAARRPG